jgi:GGDEF domain-containing protein
VALFDPQQPVPLEEVMARADAAMYAVKRLRRTAVKVTP